MNIKKAVIIGCFSCAYAAYGQTSKGERSLKIYSNYQSSSNMHVVLQIDTVNHTILKSGSTTSQFGAISPAINWTNHQGKRFEFELSNLAWTKDDQETFLVNDSTGGTRVMTGGGTIRNFKIAVRQEYIFDLLKNADKSNFSLSIGVAANPYFSRMLVDPKVSQAFNTANTTIGAFLSVVPRLNYAIGEKWYLDVNVPLHLAKIDFERNMIDNPNFEPFQRSTSTLDIKIPPRNSSFRIGVGVRI